MEEQEKENTVEGAIGGKPGNQATSNVLYLWTWRSNDIAELN